MIPRVHSEFEYAFGPVDCDGELKVMDTIDGGKWLDVQCLKCGAKMAVPDHKQQDWRKRKDIGDDIPY